MEYKDYYKTLGVAKNATEKEIKAAYRRLARKLHPDVNPNNHQAEARFKEINEANEVLSDPEKRKRYDQLGANWRAYESGVPAGGGWGRGGRVRVKVGGFEQDLGGFSDFFRTFFGGGAPEGWGGDDAEGSGDFFVRQPAASGDVERELAISLAEVLKGATRTIKGGSQRTVEVKIPPGMRDGARVRVSGEGAKAGGRAGDLYLRVRVEPHRHFAVRNDDVTTTVSVPLTTAVLGGDLDLPTLDGRVNLKVPPGSPAGRVLRVKGQGLPRQGERGARGDLLVTLAVNLPTDLSRRERELFEELRALGR
jgi:curved DNA-binding protein